jgi:hypothetical protein
MSEHTTTNNPTAEALARDLLHWHNVAVNAETDNVWFRAVARQERIADRITRVLGTPDWYFNSDTGRLTVR